MKRRKITVIGGGNVGATAAHIAAMKGLADVVLVDINEGLPQGKALDIQQSLAIEGVDCKVIGTNGYAETANSDICILTAGMPRKPGMSRDDLVSNNTGIVKSCAEQFAKGSPNGMMIVVANPLDAMVYVAQKVTGWAANRVFGMSGVLDTARYKTFLAEEIGCSVKDISGFVLGGHGDTMVPLPRYTCVEGIPVTKFVKADKLAAICDRAKNGGAEIVKLLQKGSAYYAPAASAVDMAEAILKDRKRVMPTCAFLNGEYGVDGVPIGVPAVLGDGGVEKIIELDLSPDEKSLFEASVNATKNLISIVKL